jgi:hypothetical protein
MYVNWLTALMLVSTQMVGNNAQAQNSTYASVRNSHYSLTIDALHKEVQIGDLAQEAQFCEPSSSFYCFSSASLSFYVPKKITKDSWEGGGLTYSVEKRETLVLLGMSIPVLRISVRAPAGELIFLYSEQRGLIGIGMNEASGFLMLVESVGFGAHRQD